MLLLDLLEFFWDNYWCNKPGCQCTGMHAAIPEHVCCAASLLLVRAVPTGEAGDHQSIVDPPSAAPPKAPGAAGSM